MNAVEIEQAVSDLVEAPFDAEEFPYAFLVAFGNKNATIKRLRTGSTNKSDLGGVLQRSNIHIKVCEPGEVGATLEALRESPTTASQKAKYVLATDGQWLEAENLTGEGGTLACELADLPNHFGFFLTLAGITTVQQISENAFDIRATSRLNKLYVELLKHNPDWGTADRREALNHFFARLIFCFFAEDTNIFRSHGLFTATIAQMTEADSSNTHEVIAELFRVMNTKLANRGPGRFRPWADCFPYVNGGLFSDSVEVPRFSKMARSYLLHIGGLDWTRINPDIFGSMIQAVAEDEERGELGMHYTSVPNILKVLNPLFLDDLREKLEEAGDGSDQGSKRKLLNLRNRIARIRVFDPACGSGNFLVIAYKHMREIEHEINERRGERGRKSDIPLTNFRGIEIRHFAAEIARLALVIAEFQCDVNYRGERMALLDFLPLDGKNWIVHGNALRLDWLDICPPTGTGVKLHGDDLFRTKLEQSEMDFENEGGETYICGNPPYKGSQDQTREQKADLEHAFAGRVKSTKSLDYVSGWFARASDYLRRESGQFAFVATNSIFQGRQVSLWRAILSSDLEIVFAEPSFSWRNLAAKAAVVTVSIAGVAPKSTRKKLLYIGNASKSVGFIGPYLVPDQDVIAEPRRRPLSSLDPMVFGSMPNDGGHLLMSPEEARTFRLAEPSAALFIRKFIGSDDAVNGTCRYCLWIDDTNAAEASRLPLIQNRLQLVKAKRLDSDRQTTKDLAQRPHSFGEVRHQEVRSMVIPRHTSEDRQYLPFELLGPESVIADSAIALPNVVLHEVGIFSSRLHLVWVTTVCGKLETRYRYSNTLGWNTFPVPPLTEQNKADLTRCAEGILLARESYWPATIADMYDPGDMDAKYPALRAAHEANDETLERIYIGRRFKNDTERLEKLFEMYTKMVARDKPGGSKPGKNKATSRKGAKK